MITGPAPVSDRAALRAALSHMRITSPDGISFEEALAEENGWSLGFAERVADEYSGFLYLAATAGFEVTPSECVDRAWHLHLTWPHYQEVLCREMIGRPLGHRPGTGERGEEERYRRQYVATLALYEEEFGKAAPADIWPCCDLEGEALEAERERGRALSLRVALVSLAAAIPLAPFATILAFILIAIALIFILLAMPWESLKARSRKEGSCGGGDGWSDGGASCGGGGCGGGCGGG